jgi:hypothetical protein
MLIRMMVQTTSRRAGVNQTLECGRTAGVGVDHIVGHRGQRPTSGGFMRTSAFVRCACSAAFLALVTLSAAPGTSSAQKAPAAKKMPRTATARCGDNTWSTAATQQGACSRHGGVAKWFGTAPRGTTGRCNDGEYWTNEETRGACSAHGGVAFWTKKGKAKKAS